MINSTVMLLTSIFLFLIGIIGIMKHKSMVRIIISLELSIFASMINFCYFSGKVSKLQLGHYFAIIAFVLSGLTISVLYTLNPSDIEIE